MIFLDVIVLFEDSVFPHPPRRTVHVYMRHRAEPLSGSRRMHAGVRRLSVLDGD